MMMILRRTVKRELRQFCTKHSKPTPVQAGQKGQKFQRSSADRAPKVVVAALGVGIACAFLSTIAYFEATRPQCEPVDSVLVHKEKVTGTSFPLTLSGYTASDSTHWLGVASVRCMLNLCAFDRARAYCYGVYITPESATRVKDSMSPKEMAEVLLPRAALTSEVKRDDIPEFIAVSSFQGSKPGYVFKMGVPNDSSDNIPLLGYYKDMVSIVSNTVASEHRYESMILRLVFLHDAGGEHLAHGFDKTLLWRVKSVQGKAGDGKEALKKLNRFIISKGVWKKGTILEFVRMPGGVLEFKVDGVRTLSLHSETISWALFDAYIGQKGHLNNECKEELLERAHEIHSLLNE